MNNKDNNQQEIKMEIERIADKLERIISGMGINMNASYIEDCIKDLRKLDR